MTGIHPPAREVRILAVDLGTTAIKAALWDANGYRVPGSAAQAATPFTADALGAATIDPDELQAATVDVIDRALAGCDRPVMACGWSCFWHSLLGVGADGAPVTPVFTWADTRAAPFAAMLARDMEPVTLKARTGCPPSPVYWPAKLRWVRAEFPDEATRVWRWMSAAEWVIGRFCGCWACATGMATATGLMCQADGTWDVSATAWSGWKTTQFNPISDTPLRLGPAWASRWPQLAGAALLPAIGDGATGTIGSGANHEGRLAVNLGTSAAVRRMLPAGALHAPAGLFDYRINSDQRLAGAAVSNAGNVIGWAAGLFGLDAGEALANMGRNRSGKDDLVAVADWVAERAPGAVAGMWSGGTLLGIRPDSDRLALFRAVVDAVLERVAGVLDCVDPDATGLPILSGGWARSPQLAAAFADAAGRAVEVSEEPEASLRGAAIVAIEVAGFPTPSPPARVRFEPDPAAARAFRHGATRSAQVARALARAAHLP